MTQVKKYVFDMYTSDTCLTKCINAIETNINEICHDDYTNFYRYKSLIEKLMKIIHENITNNINTMKHYVLSHINNYLYDQLNNKRVKSKEDYFISVVHEFRKIFFVHVLFPALDININFTRDDYIEAPEYLLKRNNLNDDIKKSYMHLKYIKDI